MNPAFKKATSLFKLVGLIFFGYILTTLDYPRLLSVLQDVKPLPFLIYCIGFYAYLSAQTYRWHIIQRFFSKPIGFYCNLSLNIESFFLRYITPGRLGDTIKVLLLDEKYQIPKKTGMLIYFFDRLQDLFYMSILAMIGIYLYMPEQPTFVIYLVCAAIIVGFIFKNTFINIALKILKVTSKVKTSFKFEAQVATANLVMFGFYFWQGYFLAQSLGMDIHILKIGTIMAMAAIISLIPISISGLGIREGVFIFFLTQFGFTNEQAVLFSLLDNIFMPIVFIFTLEALNRLYINPKIDAKKIRDGEPPST